MVNPGAFSGSRKAFLLSQKEYYASAVDEGIIPEAIAVIQRRYFLRYPIELPHDVEPSEEDLAAVDDNAAVPDVEGPDPALLSLEDYEAALSKWEERQKLVLFRKAQIKRWFAYQYMKDMDLDATSSGACNPYRALIAKLIGKGLNAPRQRSAANTWRKTQREAIDAEIQRQLKETPVEKDQLIAFRDRVAREMFQALPQKEQETWAQTAVAEHKVAMKAWKAEMEAKLPTDPRSRQIAIQGLVKFLQPILDLICEATGWKASFICGGPEPALGGRLNVVSIHSGSTSGDIKLSFARAERAQFRKVVVPLYGQFLQRCFTAVECRARALGDEQGYTPLSQCDLENEAASVDEVFASSAPPAIRLGTPPVSTLPPSAVEKKKTAASKKKSGAIQQAAPAPAGSSQRQQATPGTQPSSAAVRPTDPATQPQQAAPPAPSLPSAQAVDPSPQPQPQQPPAPAPAPPACSETTAMQARPVAEEAHRATPEPDLLTEAGSPSNPFPFQMPLDSPRGASPNPTPLPSPIHQSLVLPPNVVPNVARGLTPALSPSLPRACEDLPRPALVPTSTIPAAQTSPTSAAIGRPSGENISVRRSERAAQSASRGNMETSRSSAKKRVLDVSEPTTDSPSSAGPRDKRPRTSLTQKGSSLEHFIAPSDAPDWFKKALTMVSSRDMGEEWRALLGIWGRFEAEAGYSGDQKIGASHRPVAIKDWIQRARSPTWRPNIRDSEAFGSQVREWWVGLQPEERVGSDNSLSKSWEGDWGVLRRPGVNGLLSIVAALFFWGYSLGEAAQDNEAWLEVVRDFQFVLARFAPGS